MFRRVAKTPGRLPPAAQHDDAPLDGAHTFPGGARRPLDSSPPADSARLQAKTFAVSTPGDVFEREADRVASRVQHVAEPGLVQRRTTENGETRAVPSTVQGVLGSPGSPLDSDTRTFMEARFGHDFSRVRVHSDAAAQQSARDVSATAYTVANHIAFDSGRFAPGTQEGRRLIAHELTHVVQQAGSTFTRLSREPKLTSPTATATPGVRESHPVEKLMGQVLSRVDASTRKTLVGDPEGGSTGFATLAISEFAVVDRSGKLVELEYRWATNDNFSNPNLRKVMEELGLEQLADYTPVFKAGESKKGLNEHHAEVLTTDATTRRKVLTALCVARPVCLGCQRDLTDLAEKNGLELTASKQGRLSLVQFSPKPTGGKLGTTDAREPQPERPGSLRKAIFAGAPTSLTAGLKDSGGAAPSINQAPRLNAAAPLPGAAPVPSADKNPGPSPAPKAGARPSPIRTAAGGKRGPNLRVQVPRTSTPTSRGGSQRGAVEAGLVEGLSVAIIAILDLIAAIYIAENFAEELGPKYAAASEAKWRESLESFRPRMARVITEHAAAIQRWQEDGREVSLLVAVLVETHDLGYGLSLPESLTLIDAQLQAEGLPTPILKRDTPGIVTTVLKSKVGMLYSTEVLEFALEGTRSDVRRLRQIEEQLAGPVAGEERARLIEEQHTLTGSLPEHVSPPGSSLEPELNKQPPAAPAFSASAATRSAAITAKRAEVRGLERPSPLLNNEQRLGVEERLRAARVDLRLLELEDRRGTAFGAEKRGFVVRLLQDVVFYEWKAENRPPLGANERATLNNLQQRLDEITY